MEAGMLSKNKKGDEAPSEPAQSHTYGAPGGR